MAGKGSSTRRLGTVVSFGTGRPPIVPVKTVDVFMPESMFSLETAKAVLGAKNLGTLLVEQATAADGMYLGGLPGVCFRFNNEFDETMSLMKPDVEGQMKRM